MYNFLIDFMGVERAIGEFVIFMPDKKRQEWLQKAYAATVIRQKGDTGPTRSQFLKITSEFTIIAICLILMMNAEFWY